MAEDKSEEKPKRRMPVQLLPEFDLGDLAKDEDTDAVTRKEFEQWRGWKVVYRGDRTQGFLASISYGKAAERVNALRGLVHSWNFVDENGEAMPQPTRATWTDLILQLPDTLLTALVFGYLAALDIPKANTSS